LFAIHGDYQIEWHTESYNAVGCGGEIALGALAVLAHTNLEPLLILERALTVAEQFSGGVRGPFHYVTTTRQNN
jgi:ATP-dependent protease HslVU (ClpYQ) peptidase subunit